MTYPLNVNLPAPLIGFAVANDADEHQRLTEAGYEPKFVATAATEEDPAPAESADRASLIAQAAAKGLKVDRRWSDARLAEEIAKAGA